jgi:GT2 family glycosyltransferase
MPEHRRPRVAVTAVSSNEGLMRQFLESLARWGRSEQYSLSIYAAWNAPGRGGPPIPSWVKTEFPDVHAIESSVSGFEVNQNLLLRDVEADYILIANDDLIFLEGSLNKPVAYLEDAANRDIGVLGIRLLNADRTLQPSTYSFPGLLRAIVAVSNLRSLIPLSPRLFAMARMCGLGSGKSRYWTHDRTCEVDMFRGSYILVRGETLAQAGLFDVNGGQETEWMARVHQVGWKVLFYSDAEIIHLGSATVSKDPSRELIFLRTFLTFFRRHGPRWRHQALRLWCLAYFGIRYCFAAALCRLDDIRVARQALELVCRTPGK